MTSTWQNMASVAPSPGGDQTPSARADAVAFRIDGATESDPCGILASVTQSGDDITVVSGGIGISNFPDTAASWERPLEDIFGAPAAFDLGDIFRAIGRVSALSAPADVHFGMSIESVDGQRGAAWRIAAVAGQWQVQHTSKTTGTWAPWTAGKDERHESLPAGVCAGARVACRGPCG